LNLVQHAWQLGDLTFSHRLIQGPLAGVSASPFRRLFARYLRPAYCVSEMISANDVVHKLKASHRWLHRDPLEEVLAYQLSGIDPEIMAQAARICVALGGDIIDINAGCPKPKIRSKGAGSALLETPQRLFNVVGAVRDAITCPLTVKIRLTDQDEQNLDIALKLADLGIDALIVHGREHGHDYDVSCQYDRIDFIRQRLSIALIVNGDIHHEDSLRSAMMGCPADAYMISRAGTGQPWLFQALLKGRPDISLNDWLGLWHEHLEALMQLEGEHTTLFQSRRLLKYYLKSLQRLACCPKDLDVNEILLSYYRASNFHEAHKILASYLG